MAPGGDQCMSWKQALVAAVRSPLAVVLALVAFCAANQFGGWLAAQLGLPPGGGARLGWDLGWMFVAGVLAAWCLAWLAPPRAARAHVAVFFVALMAFAAWVVAGMGGDWPWWFSGGVLATMPLQAWLGLRLPPRRARRAPR